MLLAETAILVHFQTIGVVLLVLDGIVIALFALGAGQHNLNTLIRCHGVDTSYGKIGQPPHSMLGVPADWTTTATHILGQTYIV